jgi:hypothetical protein
MNEPNEKRSVPLTIWITPAELARLQGAIERLASRGQFAVLKPKLSITAYAFLQSGLSDFELSESDSFPAHSPPAGKISRRPRKSDASNVTRLKQSA